MASSRNLIRNIVASIEPFDDIEAAHQQDVLDWIKSGAPLFRITKPDNPPKHLVSYFVLFDAATNKLMLVDHAKAEAWLPAGGHVEQDEDPRVTVIRESDEELGVTAKFDTAYGNNPLFVTVGTTKGYGNHTDVSLWYVINGDSSLSLTYDPKEMHGYKWLTFDEVLTMDISTLDPHLHRFVRKMRLYYNTPKGFV